MDGVQFFMESRPLSRKRNMSETIAARGVGQTAWKQDVFASRAQLAAFIVKADSASPFLKPWTTEVATQRRSLLQPGRFIAAQSRQDSSFTVRDLAPTPQWSENPQETRVFTRPGKRLHSELERSTMLSMGSIPLFRLGHVQYKLPEGTPKA